MKILFGNVLFFLCTLVLSSCGGAQQSSPQKADTTIKAVIKTTALTADRNIAGIDLTVTVPVGVHPTLLADGTVNAAASVEIISSATQGTLPGATYSPASATVPGQLKISAIVASGFKQNDQITIHLQVDKEAFPVESDFKLLSFAAFDINGAPVTGLSPTLTITIQ
jgi:hypothetical protein